MSRAVKCRTGPREPQPLPYQPFPCTSSLVPALLVWLVIVCTRVTGTVLSVNVGGVRSFEDRGRVAQSAMWKFPVVGRVGATGVNLHGDEQADRNAHGGWDKAVYAYAVEDYRWWQTELYRALQHGEFGENLTTAGVDLTGTLIGERWQIGSVLLEVSEPRVPCWRLGTRLGDTRFPSRFSAAGRPGAYLRIRGTGDLGAGDEIRVVSRPTHRLTVGDVFRIYTRDHHEAHRLLGVAELSRAWSRWAERRRRRS